MASRVVHTKVAFTLGTNSYISPFRIIIARHWNAIMWRKFILTMEVIYWCRKRIEKDIFWDEQQQDLIIHGEYLWRVDKLEQKPWFWSGVCKRQISSACVVLIYLLKTHGRSLENEYLLCSILQIYKGSRLNNKKVKHSKIQIRFKLWGNLICFSARSVQVENT